MKLITSRFLRKQKYYGNFIYAWYCKQYFTRFYRVNYLFSDGSSFVTYQGSLDVFYRRHEITSVYFDLFTEDLYKSEEKFFLDFVKACNPKQLATFLHHVEDLVDATLYTEHFDDFKSYVIDHACRES